MAESHPIELRVRVVQAYEAGQGSYPEIAALFGVGEASAKRWVWLKRRRGDVMPTRNVSTTNYPDDNCRKDRADNRLTTGNRTGVRARIAVALGQN